MSRLAGLGLAAVAGVFSAVPADAVTYTGTLNGVITSGGAFYYNYIDYSSSSVDLVGKAVSIDFIADIESNYTDPIFGDFYPKYIVNMITVTIPAPSPFDVVASTQSNSVALLNTYADYTGDSHNGSFFAAGDYIPDPDFPQSVSFSFTNASAVPGPVGGNGNASASFYNPFSGEDDSYAITFAFTDGFVTASGTPEPASWALMILGFGAIGGMMRRQRVQVSYAGASLAR